MHKIKHMQARRIQIPLLFLLMPECFVCGVCRSSSGTEEAPVHVLLLVTAVQTTGKQSGRKGASSKSSVFPFNHGAKCCLLAWVKWRGALSNLDFIQLCYTFSAGKGGMEGLKTNLHKQLRGGRLCDCPSFSLGWWIKKEHMPTGFSRNRLSQSLHS